MKISASAVEGTDYDYAGGILTIISNKEMTISGGTDKDNPLYDEVIVVNSPSGANITLRKAYLQVRSGSKFAALEINEDISKPVTITLEDDNLLKSTTSGYAGLQKNGDSCKLTINGSGKLTAIGGTDGAAIGGAAGIDSGNIEISGSADVTAKGDGAGIGGGNGGDGSNITIGGSAKVDASSTKGAGIGGGGNGGKGSYITIKDTAIVDKASSISGAGIGGGNGGEGSNIIISGGTVTATSSNGGAGIGGGNGGVGSDITITGGKITATGMMGAGIGGGQSSDGTRITISGGIIDKASATGPSAGIGGGYNGDGTDITICGDADVTATGGSGGASIGGGNGGNGTGIKIYGSADVKATGGSGGAGIGGGYRSSNKGGNGSGIKISGGKVLAIGNGGGAGIGGGYGGKGSDIEISGGTVEATIANTSGSTGAGIGGGYGGDAENIKITGGTVKAYVPSSAPAIGSGGGSGSVDGIYISGNADVIAAASGAAGIGCGSTNASEVKNIEIFGNAKVRAYSQNHAGIGGTNYTKTVDTIKIYGDANVTAITGYGAGIGGSASGSNQEVNNISIYGNASVTAISGYGAGIGGGAWNNNAKTSGISISDNATVIATGNNGGAGIGSGTDDTATNITISDNATVIASSAYNKDLYDPSIYKTTLTINGAAITQFENGNIGEWLDRAFSPSGTGVGIGSNKTDECVIMIEGGTVTAYGNTKPGIGDDNADVTIAGKNSKSCPIVCTNEIKSTTNPDDYPTEYWGIVFEDTTANFMKGTVYGDDKAVDLSERPETYTLDNGKVLTVLDNVTFIPGNKFTLDASTLYLEEYATLDKWYEMTKVNGGEIQHVHRSQYEWYDVKDYSFVATDYTTLYKSGDKEGIVLCDICGKPESHIFKQEGGWKYNVDYHWHEGECDLRMDCSVNPQTIEECTYIKEFGGKFDKGEHRYDFSAPEKKDGKLHFYCIDCDYEILMDIPVITLIKVDGATNNPLIGAEFGLYTNAACTGTPSATGTTATENGKAVVSFEAMPNMTYYIKETKAPDGYKLSDKIFKVTVNADGKVTYGDDGSETSPICENTVDANEPDPDDNNNEPDPDDNGESKPNPDDNGDNEPGPDDNGESKPDPDDNGESKPAPDDNGESKPDPDDNGESKPNPDDNGDSKPAPDDNDESKPAPDDNGDSKPAPDDNGESKPAPDNNGESKPDDNDNPNTGIGIGIAGLTLLGGSLCVVAVTKGRRKKKNSNDSDIDF